MQHRVPLTVRKRPPHEERAYFKRLHGAHELLKAGHSLAKGFTTFLQVDEGSSRSASAGRDEPQELVAVGLNNIKDVRIAMPAPPRCQRRARAVPTAVPARTDSVCGQGRDRHAAAVPGRHL